MTLGEQDMERIVELLNRMLFLDRESITKLFTIRQTCSPSLENDGVAIVRADHTVSALGVFNGIMDNVTDGQFRIAAEFDPESNIINEFRLIRVKNDGQ
jgi:hypothetical protein